MGSWPYYSKREATVVGAPARTLLEAPGLTTRNKKILGGTRSYQGRLASLLGARTLLEAPGLTTRNKKLLGGPGITTGARTLLGAPGLTTRNKKLR